MRKSLLLSIILFSYSVIASTLYVDINGSQSYTNIQDAIDTAPINGWTDIIVYPGVYHENLIVQTNQHLSISSTNEFSEQTRWATVIDGGATDSVLKVYGIFFWQSGTTCTVSGVTITNGVAASGGGICGSKQYSSAVNFVNVRRCNIINCHSTSNALYEGGGAIAYTEGYVISNQIIGNSSANSGGGIYNCNNGVSYNLIANNIAYKSGGGIFKAQGNIYHNVISNNFAQTVDGGGMAIVNGPVAYNLITLNYAHNDGGGGYSLRDIEIYNNEFSFNVAGNNGGGLCNNSYSQANNNLINNLICNNIASNEGGGICYFDDSFSLNNTIADNWSKNEGGGVYGAQNTFWLNTIIQQNIAEYDNTSSNIYVNGDAIFYNCCLTDVSGIDASNISSDPQFTSNSFYHLEPTSPCINSGISNMFYSMLPWHDLNGKLRNQNGVDMGCYELGTLPDGDGDLLVDTDEPALLANSNKWDTNGDGFSDGMSFYHGQSVTNNLTNETFYVTTADSVQAAMAKMAPGDSLNLSAGTFQELLIPYFGIKIIGTTNEHGEIETVIDGENKRSVLYNYHDAVGVNFGIESLLANLIISNGNEYIGGGIYSLRSTSGYSITNCTFINNHAINGGAIASPKENPDSSGKLMSCKFVSNSAEDSGGAVYNMSFIYNIENCLFINNTATNGAVLTKDGSIVDRCVFSNNTAIVYGGAIYDSFGDIRNCLMINNNAQFGGAIASEHRYSLDIQNNTFCKNTASQYGGAIYETSKKYGFLNNIVWGNTATNGAQIYWDVTTTNFFYNTIQDWDNFDNNNLSNNPDFINYSTDDFHLKTNSYCIDSGTNSPPEIYSWFDLDDSFRVVGYYVDRGCYEFYNSEDDIDYNTATQRLIVVVGPPGGGKIIKKVVVYKLYPCESNQRTRISYVSYPAPGNVGDTVKHIATAADNSTLCSVNGTGRSVFYQGPNAKTWTPVGNSLPGYPYVDDIFPRDGYPGWVGFSHLGTKDDYNPGVMYVDDVYDPNFCITATLPVPYIDSGIALPGDITVASGQNSTSNNTSWSFQPDPNNPFAGSVYVTTLPACYYGSLGNYYTPAYVMNGLLTLAPGDNVNYEPNKIWYLDNTSGNVALKNITDDSTVLTVTTPLPGGGDYLIGSFPDGLAVAEKNTKTLYTYVYDPTTPENGTWCTDYFEYVITKLGYSTTKEVIAFSTTITNEFFSKLTISELPFQPQNDDLAQAIGTTKSIVSGGMHTAWGDNQFDYMFNSPAYGEYGTGSYNSVGGTGVLLYDAPQPNTTTIVMHIDFAEAEVIQEIRVFSLAADVRLFNYGEVSYSTSGSAPYTYLGAISFGNWGDLATTYASSNCLAILYNSASEDLATDVKSLEITMRGICDNWTWDLSKKINNGGGAVINEIDVIGVPEPTFVFGLLLAFATIIKRKIN